MRCSPCCSYGRCRWQMGWQWCRERPGYRHKQDGCLKFLSKIKTDWVILGKSTYDQHCWQFVCSWCLTSTPVIFCGSNPSHISMTRESPTARSTRTASVWVIPSRLWLFTSRIRIPTFSLLSLAAAPLELTCLISTKGEVSQKYICNLMLS